MDGVERLGLGLGQADAARGHDAKAGVFEAGNDLAGQIAAGGIGFDDGQRAFDGHGNLLEFIDRNSRGLISSAPGARKPS